MEHTEQIPGCPQLLTVRMTSEPGQLRQNGESSEIRSKGRQHNLPSVRQPVEILTKSPLANRMEWDMLADIKISGLGSRSHVPEGNVPISRGYHRSPCSAVVVI
jgi:hypothetical protein